MSWRAIVAKHPSVVQKKIIAGSKKDFSPALDLQHRMICYESPTVHNGIYFPNEFTDSAYGIFSGGGKTA